jgi:energy-converting hydrogenase Eha subunit A
MNKNFCKYSFIIITFLVIIGLLSFNKLQQDKRIKVNNELSLILPTPNLELDELLTSLKEINENIIFLRSIGKLKSKPVLFAVSRYVDSKKIKLDTVFYNQTVNVKVSNLGNATTNYKLISYNKYKKGNKLLYTKVTSPMEGQCSVMYYFMKNEYNNVMYEIKLSGGISEIESIKTSAERIALSVKI